MPAIDGLRFAKRGASMVETAGPRCSTRERILKAASHLFALQGYENTSTLSIAQVARTSETQLMKNFRNKEGLLQAVFGQVLANLAQVMEEVQDLPDPRQKIREFFLRLLARLEADREMKMLLVLDMRRVRHKDRGDLLLPPGIVPFISDFDRILREAQGAGQLRPDLRPGVVRTILFGAISELLRDSLVAEDPTTGSVTPDETRCALDDLLECLFAPAAGTASH